MTKKILFLTILIFSSCIYARVEELNNVRYEKNGGLLIVSPIDTNQKAQIDSSLMVDMIGQITRIEKGITLPDNSDFLFINNQTKYSSHTVEIDPTIDVSNVTSMRGLFWGVKKVTGISNWDVSNVTDMAFLFANSENIPDISNWNVSNVTDMIYMFNQYKGNIPDLSRWNVSNVRSMDSMFLDASFTNLFDISDWNVSNVTSMNSMFKNYNGIIPNLSRWNVSNVKSMTSMFNQTLSTNLINISDWDVSNVTNMKNMFMGSHNAITNLNNWNVSNVTDMSGIFQAYLGNIPDISNWDVSNVTDMSRMFKDYLGNIPDISNWDVSNVANMRDMFFNTTSANPDVSRWDVSNVTDMSQMFYNAQQLDPDVSNWNVSNVTNMTSMFSKAKLATPDTRKWNLKSIQEAHFFITADGLYNKIVVERGHIFKMEDARKFLVTSTSEINSREHSFHEKLYQVEFVKQDPNIEGNYIPYIPDASTLGMHNVYIRMRSLVGRSNPLNKDKVVGAGYIVVTNEYNNKIRKLNQVDTSIINFDNQGFYIEGNFKHDYFNKFRNIVNDKFNLSNLLGGIKLGTNINIQPNLSLGAFLEYDYDIFHLLGLGTKMKYTINNNDISGFLRYKLHLLDMKPRISVGHNLDIYLRHTYNYTKNNFFIQSQLSGLASYGSDMKLDQNVTLTSRLIIRADLGFKIGGKISSTKIYFEPTLSGQYTTDHYLIDSNGVQKVDITPYILNFRAKLGMEHKISGFNIKESILVDYLGNLKANFGLEYLF